MKGLRPKTKSRKLVFLPASFLPCDLNEGITTHGHNRQIIGIIISFLPCDLNEGITTITAHPIPMGVSIYVFTLWPEWRDYDPLNPVGIENL